MDGKSLDELSPNELRDLIRRIHNIHWRLRLRNPTTEAELKEWREVRTKLRELIPPEASRE